MHAESQIKQGADEREGRARRVYYDAPTHFTTREHINAFKSSNAYIVTQGRSSVFGNSHLLPPLVCLDGVFAIFAFRDDDVPVFDHLRSRKCDACVPYGASVDCSSLKSLALLWSA